MRTTIKTIEGETLTSINNGVPASTGTKIRSCGETFEVVNVVHDYDHGGVVQIVYVYPSRSSFYKQLEERAAQEAFLSDLVQAINRVLRIPFDIKPLEGEDFQKLAAIAHRVAIDLSGSYSIPTDLPTAARSDCYGYALSGLCQGYEEELKLLGNQSHCFGKALVYLHSVLSKHKVPFSVNGVKLGLIAQVEQEMPPVLSGASM